MSNDDLYDAAVEAINRFFFDQSVSQDWTRIGLKSLRDEIDGLIDILENR